MLFQYIISAVWFKPGSESDHCFIYLFFFFWGGGGQLLVKNYNIDRNYLRVGDKLFDV